MSRGNETPGSAVILYDGDCGLCDRLVQFVLPRDPAGHHRFAALQSEYGRSALQRAGLPTDDLDTMVLIEGGRISVRSTAALRVLRRLKAPWPLLSLFLCVPRPIRDFVYARIAQNRGRFFQRTSTCGLPKPGWEERFLDAPGPSSGPSTRRPT